MGFFDAFPVPEPPEPPRQRRSPIWHDPGRSIVPVALVVDDGLLVRKPELAVFANDFRVYPAGFGFSVTVLRRPRRPGADEDRGVENPFGRHRRGVQRSEAEDGRDLRIGVRFADGRSADAEPRRGPGAFVPAPGRLPEPPLISMRGGHGSTGHWQQTLWVWGLPEKGDVELVYSWAAEEVPESSLVLDGDALREAAGRATVLWVEPEAEEDEDDAAR